MTLRGNDGSILSRENYKYEFDTFGNWRKMVTSLVLFENGNIKHEPVEVTYRELAYYFDDSVAKIVNPIPPPIVLPTPSFRFPGRANAVSPEIRLARVVGSDRPLLFDVGGEPPELPAPAKNESKALTRSNAESVKPSTGKAEPAAISLTPANGISVEATRSTVPAPKETGNKSDVAARRGALAYYEKGREYFDLGALKEAVTSYQRSLELEPRSAEVYLSLGNAYLKLQNNQEAGKAFQHATLLRPDLAEAHYGLGLFNFRLGRNKNAADAFKRATVLRPDMAKAHYGLAIAYQELGKLDALIAEFRILENLDRDLAKKLSDTFPEFAQPCRVPPFCK
ncbi:MAG: tetratricopeptide repeat protein [Pyrinomonadaceae bacterium]